MSSDSPDPTRGDDVAELDEQALARLGQLDPGGQKGLMRKVLATYRGTLGRLGGQVRDGLAAGDWPTVRLAAHTLKSSSASVGALELSRLCAQLESAARDAQSGPAEALAARVQRELDRVARAVDRRISS